MPYLNDDDSDLHELFSRYDYNREAYGDPCPYCGELRWQADCPSCTARDEAAAIDFEMREAAMKDGGSL